MGELQTIDEMREAYKDEWALVVDCEHDESGWTLRGRVVAHSLHRDDIYEKLENYPGGVSIEYFGDDDPTILL